MSAERGLALVPLDELVEARSNPKLHDLESLGASLTRFGYIEPIVRDERTGRLVSGHGRTESIKAARDAGAEPPEGVEMDEDGRWLVYVATGWQSADDDEADAAVIALNRVGEKGGWDKPVLAAMLSDLDLTGVGYTDDDMAALLAECSTAQTETFNADRGSGGATRADSSLEEREEGFLGKNTRSFVLDYDLTEYATVQRRAHEARVEMGLDTVAEVFDRLVRDWGEDHP